MIEARGTIEQINRAWWPADHVMGIVTTQGRCFHRSTSCHQYRGCVTKAERRGIAMGKPERVNAREAKARLKGVCVCFRDN